MFLTGKIKTLTNGGGPDYMICGQASAALSFTDMTFRLTLSKANGAEYILVNTTDLSTYVAAGLPVTYNYGNYDITFSDFDIDTVNSAFQARVEVFYAGTTDIVTWEKFNITLQILKTGYQSFLNTFEFYNYDVGNSTGTAGLTSVSEGNTDFEIFLTDDTDNLDSYGRQTRVASKFIALRRPFTDEIHFYNMIGTQGTISYSDTDGVIGNGNHIVIHDEEDLYVEQTISVSTDFCVSNTMVLKKVWFPKFISSYSSADTCNSCTNNIAITTASYYRDATEVAIYNLHGTPYFLSEFMDQTVTLEVLNYKSEVINTSATTDALLYATWIATPSTYLTPVDWNFTPAEIGQNILSFTNLFCYIGADATLELYKCIYNYSLDTCNWWTVNTTSECNKYTVTNCSDAPLTIELQQMQEDKSMTVISTNEIAAFEELELEFSDDGIYILAATSSHITGTEYYTLPVFCNLQECFLAKLKETLCNKVTENNCSEVKHYNLNALIINAHTYFLLLDEELNYNFIYTSLPATKVDELYDLKTFIDRFEEYCESETPCVPCNQ